MNKLVCAFLFFGALPSVALAQASDILFLTCETVRQYKGPDEGKTLNLKLYLRIDPRTSIISEFNPDLTKYEDLCPQIDVTPNGREWAGRCTMDKDMVSLAVNRVGIFTTQWKNFTIYRGSGRLQGSESVYVGPVQPKDMLNKTPISQFLIFGRCQKGSDMSASEKVF
jgi:hypothetical protein